jgi:spore coat polysaccharide biosynthesis protein SpsF
MATTLAIVEVQPSIDGLRPGSPLAGIARRLFGGKTLLEWVVRRISEAQRIAGIVVLAGNDGLSRSLCASCPPGARVYQAAARDALGCMAEAAQALSGQALVRLNVSQPFVDPDLIDRLIAAAEAEPCDYASYAFHNGRPVSQSKLGVCGEWCGRDALLRADELATDAADRVEATRLLASRPDLFTQRLIPVPSQLDRDDLRLAIRDEEDWEEIQLVLDALGPESLDWQYIASLLDRQPAMRARMAQRNRLEAGIC